MERLSKLDQSRWRLLLCAGLASAACDTPNGELRGSIYVPRSAEVAESSPLGLAFDTAAARHDVPVDLLKALAYVQSGLEAAAGDEEFEGQGRAYGLFALRGAVLEQVVASSGYSPEELAADAAKDVDVVARLLAAHAAELGLTAEERRDPLSWGPVLERFADLADDLRPEFSAHVLKQLSGVAVPLADGTTFVIRGHGAEEDETATAEGGLGQAGAVWRPSVNYESRYGRSPHLVIIHTCEGGYYGCVDWLRQRVSGVSAHYVVKEDGREISQLVDENQTAWHVGQSYRDWLNGNSHPELQGIPVNQIAIGIEHGGFASQSSWPQSQIDASVALVRGIINRWDLPADRYHIVAHGRLQPEIRTDPGPNWPWTSYIAAIARGTNNPPPTTPSVLTVDNTDATRFRASGNWQSSAWASGKVGSNYRYVAPQPVSDSSDYKFNVTTAGNYEVFARVPGNGYNTRLPYVIHHRGGRTVVHKDVSGLGASWVSLGTYGFDAKDEWIVQISRWTTGTGWVVADAVKLEQR